MPTTSRQKDAPPPGGLASLVNFLRSHAPFERMSASHLEFLAKRLRPIFHARGETIGVSAEDAPGCFHIVKSGRVRISFDPAPDKAPQCTELGPGGSFVTGRVGAQGNHHATARAMEDTFCLDLEPESLVNLRRLSSVFRALHVEKTENASPPPPLDD